jgi:acetyltransferase-like isoleucine patch superfamily enzyme
LLSLPFLLILGFIIFVLGEVFSTGLIARIFRYKEGNFKLNMDDPNTFKWLVYQTIYYPFGYFLYSLTVEPLKALHLRLCGAKIGNEVNVGGFIADPCLFEVGGNTTIGGFCEILGHSAERGKFIVKKVKIDKNCLVGEFSLILPGVRMEDGSILCANSLANKNKVLRGGKVYVGTPARLIKKMILPEKR